MIFNFENDLSAVATVTGKVMNNTHAVTSSGIDACSLASMSMLYMSKTLTVESS